MKTETWNAVPGKQVSLVSDPGFPSYPASWYLFGPSREIEHRPAGRRLLGSPLVAFRDANGRPTVMEGRCPHFGADLARGRVVDGNLECPYHGWRFGSDGRCSRLPSGQMAPPFACRRIYPTQEKYGYVFFFYGEAPSFDFPTFDGGLPSDWVASRPFSFIAKTPWWSVTGQAFDIHHFLNIHDRRLLEAPLIDSPTPFARRNRYKAEIVPRHWRDRVLARVLGGTVSASLVIWGGTFAAIVSRFRSATSRFFFITCPLSEEETLCQGIVFGPRRWPGIQKLTLEIRRFFSAAYLIEENDVLQGTLSRPSPLVSQDQPLLDYFDYLRSLNLTNNKTGDHR